ncbi:MAG: helix-turn-helix transcriptional regulator [Planctomycetes bacterium]|nr:helix-turn-helix transcriptional regulator [Planctomycetota bacterium]MBI3836269.1 helix-turn-helix transcriptional regulator [Planctomycetota bacterium]
MLRKTGKKAVGCPVETTIRVIGGRWKVLVLHHLLDGTKRFAELHRALTGISHRTLTKQLRELESDGIISRKVYPQIPPKVEYSITPLGKKLSPVLFAMHDWGAEFDRVVRRSKQN